jgi:dUTP pyrophosphatase
VELKRLRPEENDLPLPSYQTPGAVAMDIQACLPEREIECPKCSPYFRRGQADCQICQYTGKIKVRNVTLNGHERMAVPTGFALKVTTGYETQLRSRSGLSLKEGVIVLNSPATIDWDYTGEVKVILFNTTGMPFIIEHGQRIAQMAVTPVVQAAVGEVKGDLPVTQRGESGFGSTGK